jgi:hypothetical protein
LLSENKPAKAWLRVRGHFNQKPNIGQTSLLIKKPSHHPAKEADNQCEVEK